jgi:DNA-binding SARP family transcriptional activator
MQFRILGPLEVTGDGEQIALGGASQRALLAVLLLHANEVVSSDLLIDQLWGDEPPASGVTALQVRVSQLRKALGKNAARLETSPSGYVLRVEPDEFDLDSFTRLLSDAESAEPAVVAEKLREALALWRGQALTGLADASFARAAIVRMDELRLAAVERSIDAELALGRHSRLVGELEALVLQHPLRERLHVQLMLALYRSGRQAEALAAFTAVRGMLVDKLGIEPNRSAQELQRAILLQDPALSFEGVPQAERSILVAARGDGFDTLLALAESLARRPPKELVITQLVADADDLPRAVAALQKQRTRLLAGGIAVRAAPLVSSTPGEDIVQFSIREDVDLVLVEGSPSPLRDPVLTHLLRHAPCDVGIVIGRDLRPGPVLVPFVGAEHDWAAVELAAWAAGALDVPLLLAGPRVNGRNASRLLASASLSVQRTLAIVAEPLLLEPGPGALMAAAEDAGVVVVGLTDRWRQEGVGEVREALAAASSSCVVLVRHGLRPGGLAPPESRTRFTWSLRG